MPLPTFLIAGTVRGATTSLHYYLEQHPAIGMSAIKEPNFFLFDASSDPYVNDRSIITKSVARRRDYEDLFSAVAAKPARGEASPLYLYTQETPARVMEVIPDVKVIALLREPISRAWSHFLHLYRGEAAAAVDRFRAAIATELPKPDVYEPYEAGHHFLRIGRYANQIDRYHETFDPKSVLALDYADIQNDAAEVLAQVCAFLGVDPGFVFDLGTVYNRSGVVRSPVIGHVQRVAKIIQPYAKRALPRAFVRQAGKARARFEQRTFDQAAPLPDDLVGQLREWYADDIARLESLLDRDLSHWRT
jgi:hypothetical protein